MNEYFVEEKVGDVWFQYDTCQHKWIDPSDNLCRVEGFNRKDEALDFYAKQISYRPIQEFRLKAMIIRAELICEHTFDEDLWRQCK